jgi:hypothetical protein
MLKFRIIGRPAEIERAVALLRHVLDVDEVSDAYASRTPDKVRVYVEAALRTPVRADAERVAHDPPTDADRDPIDPPARRALPSGATRRRGRRH